MKQYRFVLINNAGYSWAIRTGSEPPDGQDPSGTVLPQLLAEGWVPVRESPMGGGTSQLAHSLILLEREAGAKPGRVEKPARAAKPKG
jgi:hypothetical protein